MTVALLTVSAAIGWMAAFLGWAWARHLARTIEQLWVELLWTRERKGVTEEAYIAATNPGIDMDEVRRDRQRRADLLRWLERDPREPYHG